MCARVCMCVCGGEGIIMHLSLFLILQSSSCISSFTSQQWMIVYGPDNQASITGRGIFLFSLAFKTGAGLLRLIWNGYRKLNCQSMNMATYLHLLPMLRMHGFMPPHTPYIIISLCWINPLKPFSRSNCTAKELHLRWMSLLSEVINSGCRGFRSIIILQHVCILFRVSKRTQLLTDVDIYARCSLWRHQFQLKIKDESASMFCNAAVRGYNSLHLH
jgi:hypothetical protein